MEKFILIAPFAQKLRNGNENPKNYPYWYELLPLITSKGYHIVQVGVEGEQQLVDDFRKNLPLSILKELVLSCHTWISVDSFFQHFCWDVGKYGIVIWGQSDPNIFGHPENINLLKDRSYLLEKQFFMWEMIPYRYDCFVEPKEIIKYL